MFLDSEPDFRDPKNFAIVLSEEAVEKLKKAEIPDLPTYYKNKTVRVTGMVSLDEKEKPRIVVSDPKNLVVVENKPR
jgi:hypothetical protein